ncbi:MAG: hypothetical protein FWD32_00450 [Firmicutes bacterium]|nr:hypothetical protein [Bacillota bacterium]
MSNIENEIEKHFKKAIVNVLLKDGSRKSMTWAKYLKYLSKNPEYAKEVEKREEEWRNNSWAKTKTKEEIIELLKKWD